MARVPVGQKWQAELVCAAMIAAAAWLSAPTEASADATVKAVRGTVSLAPVMALGVTNPYVVSAAITERVDLDPARNEQLDRVTRQVKKVAKHGVDLKQERPDKLHLLFSPKRGFGGALCFSYRY